MSLRSRFAGEAIPILSTSLYIPLNPFKIFGKNNTAQANEKNIQSMQRVISPFHFPTPQVNDIDSISTAYNESFGYCLDFDVTDQFNSHMKITTTVIHNPMAAAHTTKALMTWIVALGNCSSHRSTIHKRPVVAAIVNTAWKRSFPFSVTNHFFIVFSPSFV